ncbi:hypothetical protein [Paenibacillus sp. WC2504]|uniref:hypothetical protein n=1 Tax=Paenibacillus sp. WC2504 TaxID=3461403 RepID=UPI0040463859
MAKVFKFALITSKGILLNNLMYTCSKAIKEQWFHHAELYGPSLIPAIYSTETTEVIKVIHDGEVLIANMLPARAFSFNIILPINDRETS